MRRLLEGRERYRPSYYFYPGIEILKCTLRNLSSVVRQVPSTHFSNGAMAPNQGSIVLSQSIASSWKCIHIFSIRWSVKIEEPVLRTWINSAMQVDTDLGRKASGAGALEDQEIKPSVDDGSSVPNGGLKAWLQVLGTFFIFFNTW